jgi:hypothetical protein
VAKISRYGLTFPSAGHLRTLQTPSPCALVGAFRRSVSCRTGSYVQIRGSTAAAYHQWMYGLWSGPCVLTNRVSLTQGWFRLSISLIICPRVTLSATATGASPSAGASSHDTHSPLQPPAKCWLLHLALLRPCTSCCRRYRASAVPGHSPAILGHAQLGTNTDARHWEHLAKPHGYGAKEHCCGAQQGAMRVRLSWSRPLEPNCMVPSCNAL